MSALDHIVNRHARNQARANQADLAHEILALHGPGAFASPRKLAVCHETGHVIVAVLDGVTIEYVEVFKQTVEQERGGAVAIQMRAMGMPDSGWAGYTGFRDSPFASDMPGTRSDIRTLDLPEFHHMLRMTLAGLAGEMILHGDPPEASSLDEIQVSQMACLARAKGNTFIAQTVWRDRLLECMKLIRENERTAQKVMALLDSKDRVEHDELYSLLDAANDNFKRSEQTA